jgi:hypothetical protein
MAATFRLSGRSHTEPGLQANWQISLIFSTSLTAIFKIAYLPEYISKLEISKIKYTESAERDSTVNPKS